MENMKEVEICESLKKLYDDSENRVKSDAFVCRAYINKISLDTINEKVNAQMNAVKAGIYEINHNFRETSKNYEQVRELVSETLSNYKNTLIELGNFYDRKIEQLILRKVELEASLVGLLLNDQYLHRKINKEINQKQNDEVEQSVQENSSSLITEEINKKENMQSIAKVEKEIALINAEIERLNEQKKRAIYDAMEMGDRTISKNIRRPKVFNKITKFFVSRFNTAKVVEATILEPLNLRIEKFRNNELSYMVG